MEAYNNQTLHDWENMLSLDMKPNKDYKWNFNPSVINQPV